MTNWWKYLYLNYPVMVDRWDVVAQKTADFLTVRFWHDSAMNKRKETRLKIKAKQTPFNFYFQAD